MKKTKNTKKNVWVWLVLLFMLFMNTGLIQVQAVEQKEFIYNIALPNEMKRIQKQVAHSKKCIIDVTLKNNTKTIWKQVTETEKNSNDAALQDLTQNMQQQIRKLNQLLGNHTFEQLLGDLLNGKENEVFSRVFKKIIMGIRNQFSSEKDAILKLFLFGILSAFFANFTSPTLKNYIGSTGYFALYMVILMVLLVSFANVYQIAQECLKIMFDTVLTIIPVFLGALILSGNYKTGFGMYGLVLMSISAVQWLVRYVLFPASFFYFTLQMLNYSMKEDRFLRLATFVRQMIVWTLRFLFGIITGMQIVQCLMLPVSDHVKSSNFFKSLAAIPGMGAGARAITGTMLNSATVLKNAVGVAGMLIVFIGVVLPVVQLLVYVVLYQLLAAILEPVAHKRIVSMMTAAAKSGKLLMQEMVTCTALYLVCIAMVTAATSGVS